MNTGKYKIGMVKAMAQYITIFCFPGMMEWLPSYFQMFNSPAIEFFVKIIRSQIEARKKQDSATERRNDMIDLVVQALEEGGSKSFKDQKAFETAAIAQIFILFFAGFDTASTASALTRYVCTNLQSKMNPSNIIPVTLNYDHPVMGKTFYTK